MKLKAIDHFVITTTDLQKCLDFYVGLLGMNHREKTGIITYISLVEKFLSIHVRASFSQLPFIQSMVPGISV